MDFSQLTVNSPTPPPLRKDHFQPVDFSQLNLDAPTPPPLRKDHSQPVDFSQLNLDAPISPPPMIPISKVGVQLPESQRTLCKYNQLS